MLTSQDLLEVMLLDVGGQELLDGARREALGYVDEQYPWNGEGDEPAERVSAYLGVLWEGAQIPDLADR